MKNIIVLFVALSLITGCVKATQEEVSDYNYEPINLRYAKGFTIDKAKGFYLVKVITPYKGASQPLTYVFYDRRKEKPSVVADAFVPIPVNTIVCTSTTHIPMLDYLGETTSLIGFPTLDYISSEAMRTRINANEIEDLGVDEALSIENLISIGPEVVMGYSLSGDHGQFGLIEEAGIPVVLNAEYLEQHPLGRAEWIKIAGALFDKEKMADSVFNYIEEQYLSAQKLVKNSDSKPTVMLGIVYGDSWFMPGGKNYAARILQDAGFNYIWEKDTSYTSLPLSFESVFDKANKANYWIGVGSFKSLEELARSDSRYESFDPFQNKAIYSYNKRIGEKGGSEFLELGYLRPDLILKDLIHIGYPNLLPEHELFFHFRLP